MLEAVLKWRIDDVIEEVLEDFTVSTNADFDNVSQLCKYFSSNKIMTKNV